jgi:hypothetical protein
MTTFTTLIAIMTSMSLINPRFFDESTPSSAKKNAINVCKILAILLTANAIYNEIVVVEPMLAQHTPFFRDASHSVNASIVALKSVMYNKLAVFQSTFVQNTSHYTPPEHNKTETKNGNKTDNKTLPEVNKTDTKYINHTEHVTTILAFNTTKIVGETVDALLEAVGGLVVNTAIWFVTG